MPLPRAVPVTLTAAERTTLTKRVRGARTPHREVTGADRAGGPLPAHRPGWARQARPGQARIRPPPRPGPAGRPGRVHREVFGATPPAAGIAPFMDLIGQVMNRPEYEDASGVFVIVGAP